MHDRLNFYTRLRPCHVTNYAQGHAHLVHRLDYAAGILSLNTIYIFIGLFHDQQHSENTQHKCIISEETYTVSFEWSIVN